MEVDRMLLSLLNRKEKLKFLDLAMHMVSVDGKPTELEQRLLNMMLAEVGDGIVQEYHFSLSKDLPETIKFFEKATPTVKNIVYLNLLKVAMTDDFYNTQNIFCSKTFVKDFKLKNSRKNKSCVLSIMKEI
jgi:hypothetical protein